jgi:hypothetical protein
MEIGQLEFGHCPNSMVISITVEITMDFGQLSELQWTLDNAQILVRKF